MIDFEVDDSEMYVSSLLIAKAFEKRHDNIIGLIKDLPQDNFNATNFKAINYTAANGRLTPL